MGVDVVTVSSKGQLVLPAKIRQKLSIREGSRLAAYVAGEFIMLKPIGVPSPEEFEGWLEENAEWAKEVGLVEEDIPVIIAEARARKRA